MRKIANAALLAATLIAGHVWALDLSGVSQGEASAGLKETLTRASSAAVSRLGATDGFLNSPKVHIPLPDGTQAGQVGDEAAGQGR